MTTPITPAAPGSINAFSSLPESSNEVLTPDAASSAASSSGSSPATSLTPGSAEVSGAPSSGITTAVDTEGVAAAAELTASPWIHEISHQLQVGSIGTSEFVEQLLQHVANGQNHIGVDRQELLSHLREAMQEDPTLLSLTKDLEREF